MNNCHEESQQGRCWMAQSANQSVLLAEETRFNVEVAAPSRMPWGHG